VGSRRRNLISRRESRIDFIALIMLSALFCHLVLLLPPVAVAVIYDNVSELPLEGKYDFIVVGGL